MPDILANDFTEILIVLSKNQELLSAVDNLITTEPISGKVTEGQDRLERFRDILRKLVANKLTINEAYQRTKIELPRNTSKYSENNRVFPIHWEERLVRTQLSRFYNQAVMEKLIAEGETECFVPHSIAEDSDSQCSLQLAGSNQSLTDLYKSLIDSYANGKWSNQVKIPNHPHCTHVITRKR